MRELDPNALHGDMYQSSYSKEQNAQFTAEFSAITNAFKDAQLAALEPGSDEVQALVAEHGPEHTGVAEGVIAACKAVNLSVPLVVRMKGTNEEIGKKMLADSGLPIISADTMEEAAQKVVAAANGK